VIVLDTNVLSAAMQSDPPGVIIAWMDAQPASSLWTTAVTVFEIRYGLCRLPDGKKRSRLEKAFRVALEEDLRGRILPFDAAAAIEAGEISASLEKSGRSVEIRDVQIAGIARARQAMVATRNIRHFDGVCLVINPWVEQ